MTGRRAFDHGALRVVAANQGHESGRGQDLFLEHRQRGIKIGCVFQNTPQMQENGIAGFARALGRENGIQHHGKTTSGQPGHDPDCPGPTGAGVAELPGLGTANQVACPGELVLGPPIHVAGDDRAARRGQGHGRTTEGCQHEVIGNVGEHDIAPIGADQPGQGDSLLMKAAGGAQAYPVSQGAGLNRDLLHDGSQQSPSRSQHRVGEARIALFRRQG